jgi:hypothetical protein
MNACKAGFKVALFDQIGQGVLASKDFPCFAVGIASVLVIGPPVV